MWANKLEDLLWKEPTHLTHYTCIFLSQYSDKTKCYLSKKVNMNLYQPTIIVKGNISTIKVHQMLIDNLLSVSDLCSSFPVCFSAIGWRTTTSCLLRRTLPTTSTPCSCATVTGCRSKVTRRRGRGGFGGRLWGGTCAERSWWCCITSSWSPAASPLHRLLLFVIIARPGWTLDADWLIWTLYVLLFCITVPKSS